MIGFGPEDDNFVCELTYNYGVGKYSMGNDFLVSWQLSFVCKVTFLYFDFRDFTQNQVKL